MIGYVGRRLVGLVPVLFGITVVIFLAMKLIPGDVARALLGPMATDQTLAQLRHALGLDQPLHVQYAKWLWRALQGDLGLSPIVHKPVVDLLLPKFWNTLVLAGASFALAAGIGIAVGVVAAARQHTALDRVAMGTSLVVGNMPPFWLGLVLIVIFAINLRWLPSLGMYSSRGDGGLADLLAHLILPAVATAAAPGAIIARMTRASVLEILGQEYITVARAKGMAERAVVCVHALRVAWPAILTIAGLQLGYLLGGAVFTEEVFGWPGLGRQLVSSVLARDVQVVQGAALFIALTFVVVNLVVDVLNLYLDPRSRPA
ncbi:MAG TPA: ABC transporter permease [Candidatus Binatia bacterium]|nr:ABC transporter permease [Candidatus Binatia bacterium]